MYGSYNLYSAPIYNQGANQHYRQAGDRNNDPKLVGKNTQSGANAQHQDLKDRYHTVSIQQPESSSGKFMKGYRTQSLDSGYPSSVEEETLTLIGSKALSSNNGSFARTPGDKQETNADTTDEAKQQMKGHLNRQNKSRFSGLTNHHKFKFEEIILGNGLNSDSNESCLGSTDLDANLTKLLKHVNHLNQFVKQDHAHQPVDVKTFTHDLSKILEQNRNLKEDRDKYLDRNNQLVQEQKAVHEMIESLCCKIAEKNDSSYINSFWKLISGRKTSFKDSEIQIKFEQILRYVENLQTDWGKQESVIENIRLENNTLKKHVDAAYQEKQQFNARLGEEATKLFVSQSANSDIINKLQAKTDSFDKLSRNFYETSGQLADARNTISNLLVNLEKESSTLQKAYKENDDLKTKFKTKTAAQIDQIKEKDELYQKLQEDLKFVKKNHERLMKDKDASFTNLERNHKNEITKLNNKFFDQCKISEKIGNDKIKVEKDLQTLTKKNKDIEEKNNYEMAKLQSIISDLEKRLKEEKELKQQHATKSLELQQSLFQKNSYLQEIQRENENLQSRLTQEGETKKKLDLDLRNLKSAILAQTNKLEIETSEFQNKMYHMSRMVERYSKKISSEHVENVENSFIKEALKAITSIRGEAEKYETQIKGFRGNQEDRKYLHLNEMLVRIIVKLDNVDSQNKEEIRKWRRSAIVFVKGLQDELEKRVTS